MLTVISSLILFVVFIILGGFHFYWLFGGSWGITKVFPTKTDKPVDLRIPKIATIIVAVGLTSIGLLYLYISGFLKIDISSSLIKFGSWTTPIVFTLRAIGEFNYVGFFRKIKNTEFAKADAKLYTPLCLSIGILGFLILFLG